MLCDVHCHLSDINSVEQKIPPPDAEVLITAGYDNVSNIRSANIADRHPNVHATLGIAPQTVLRLASKGADIEMEIESVLNTLDKKNFIGIGEIGLDYHYARTMSERNKELTVFKHMLAVAEERGMPVVIHSRDAVEDVISTVSSYKIGKGRIIMHCFSGTVLEARKAVDLGCMISIPPLITGKRKKIIAEVGLDNLVVETDAPFICKLTEITKSINIISAELSVSTDIVEAATFINAVKVFGIASSSLP